MTPEIWTIFGVAIAALILAQARHNNRLISDFRSEINGRIEGVETQMRDLRDRMSRLEGSLDVVLKFITGDCAVELYAATRESAKTHGTIQLPITVPRNRHSSRQI